MVLEDVGGQLQDNEHGGPYSRQSVDLPEPMETLNFVSLMNLNE